VALTMTLRIQAGRHGVKASVLCPGVIRTPILTGGEYGRLNLPGVSSDDVLKSWERMRPMGPEKFAERAIGDVVRGDAIIWCRRGGRCGGTWIGSGRRCRGGWQNRRSSSGAR
jgi:NAD(P)-dependent dehydrogenase (short-subunit alcohol dehydrogenase family)